MAASRWGQRRQRPSAAAAATAAVAFAAATSLWQQVDSPSSFAAPAGAVAQRLTAQSGAGTPEGDSELARAYREVVQMLRASEPLSIDGLGEGAHELAAMMPRSAWQELGRLVVEKERPRALDGSKWASLRLDGCQWGTLIGRLRAKGIVGPGYSMAIGEAMRACCRAVMDEFKGTVAYTHSDEMTILLAPTRIIDGKHMEFPFNGRLQKWVSIAASIATALFNRKLWQLAAEAGVTKPDESLSAHFDCRAGVFDTDEEAAALLLWRAYDCGVNSAQDACFLNHAPDECVRGSFIEKMLWLDAQDLLPMEPHQAYGSLFARGKGEFDTVVEHTNETVRVTRTVNIHVNDGAAGTPQNLLNFERRRLPLLPGEDDPRMALRPGSFWRYAGPSGTGQESVRKNRRGPPRQRWGRRTPPQEGPRRDPG